MLWRLAHLLRRRREDAESEKQVRWIGLGVAVGLAPFLLLSVLPRVFGLASPLLSDASVVPLVLIPLAFAYAILKWRLWDVEIFVREALATTAAVLLGGMTFVLLNALLDRHARRDGGGRARTSSRSARGSCSPRCSCP